MLGTILPSACARAPKPRSMSVFVTLHPTSNPRAKALAALKRCRVCHDFPLEFALSELVAYVNLHG